jgi:hypothetical protein
MADDSQILGTTGSNAAPIEPLPRKGAGALNGGTERVPGKDGAWSKLAARAVADRALSATALRVLAALGIYAGRDGVAWPSQETLALLIGLNRATVCRAIKCLRERGYLDRYRKRTSRGRYRNVYRLVYPHYVPPRFSSVVPEM